MDYALNIDTKPLQLAVERLGVALTDCKRGPMGRAFAQAGLRYLGFIRRRFVEQSKGGGEWPDLALSTKLGRLRKKNRSVQLAREKLEKAHWQEAKRKAADALRKARLKSRLQTLRYILGVTSGRAAREAVRGQIRQVLKRLYGSAFIRVRDTSTGQWKTKARFGAELGIEMPHFDILRDTGLLLNSLTVGGPLNVFEPLSDGIRVGTAVEYATHHQEPKAPGRPPQRKIFVPPDASTQAAITAYLQSGLAAQIRELSR